MEVVEEFKDGNVDGFTGIRTMLDGQGRKRRIRIFRETASIGVVNADYDTVITRGESSNEQLVDKGVEVPEDYVLVSGTKSKTGQNIYKHRKKRRYISRDIADGGRSHSGGIWKMADSIANLNKKETRQGTFNADLTDRIGD